MLSAEGTESRLQARPNAAFLEQLRPEMQVLMLCAQRDRTEHSAVRLKRLLERPLDCKFLVEAADYHGLTPLAWFHLQGAVEHIPEEVANRFRAVGSQVTRSNLLLASEHVKLLKLLGPSALPYKGPLLSEYLYGNLGLRPAVDIDIIVPRGSASHAIGVLLAQAFLMDPPLNEAQIAAAVRWGSEMTVTKPNVALDLHWAIAPGGFGLKVDLAGIVARASHRTIVGSAVLWPSAEDQLILLAVHAAKHLWRKLLWMADVSELLERERSLDFEVVLKRSREWGCERMVLITLLMGQRLFGAAVPESVRQMAENSAPVSQIAAKSIAAMLSLTDLTLSRARHFSMLLMREQMGQKLRYAWSLAFEPQWGDLISTPLPAWAGWAYPFVRMFRLTRLVGRASTE